MSVKVRVLYPNRELAFVAQRWEIARLDAKECVRIEYSARKTEEHPWGVPKAAVLRVPMRVALAVLAPPKFVTSRHVATRMKQDPGAGRWVQRADMGGRGAGSLPPTTIHFGMGFREATA